MSKINKEVDPKIGIVNISFFNDGIHDTIVNASIESIVEIHGITLNFIAKCPDTSSDLSYQRVFLRTSVNVDKFINGNRGNFMTAILLEQILKKLDFELKFPLPKVER